MTVHIKRIILLLWIFYLPVQWVFSQTYSSKDNYTGAWETPGSWIPTWAVPQTNVSGHNININGYITVNGSLSFKGTANKLIINDTLVIKGNLVLDNNNDITVNDNGILIVMGNFTINNQTIVTVNGYLIVSGGLTKNSSQGTFISNDNPVKVFIGGTIFPAGLTDNNPDYPALNCTAPITYTYQNSTCSYGNMTDLASDQIYSFFQNICSITNVNTSISTCAANSINLTSSHGTSYIWSGPDGFTSNVQNPSIPNATPAMAGNYTITVTASAGCTDTDTINVIVKPLPATPTITASGPLTFCKGERVTLTSSAGTSYLWSTGAPTASINVTKNGNYTVKVTDTTGCRSEASAATVVTVNALPVTPTITASGPTTFCAGDSVTLTSSTGTNYLWSTGATSTSINVTTAGSYTVQITNASGCQSAVSVPIIITVNALPATPTISADGPTTFCVGGSVTLTSSEEASYLWSNAAVTQNINITSAGSYTVRVTDVNGCLSAVSAVTIVNVNALPVVNAGADTTILNGTSTTINATVTGIGPFNYSWSPSGQLVNALVEDPTTINLTTSTVFILTATSTTTSCSNSDEVTITISGGPLSISSTASSGTVCTGTNVQLNALASGGSGTYTYTWTSTPFGFTSSVADPTANPTVSTTYNVSVFDGFTIVNSQVVVTVVDAIPATPTINAGGPTTFCTGDSVTLTSSAGTGYLWSTGATTASINVTESGSYTVQVTNASGCRSAPSATTAVTVNSDPVTPTITAGGPTAFCPGGSVTLTSSEGTSYLWSNGATTQNINGTSSGSYTVQVTNASGCQSASSVATIVTVNALPATPTITPNGPTAICVGGSLTLTSSEEASYLWSNAAVIQNINVTSAGSYTVRVTDANGCQSAVSEASIVTVNALPLVNITSSNSSMCINDLRTLTGSPAGGIFILSSGPGVINGNVLSATGIGNINLEYNFTDVCSNKAVQSIIVIDYPIANAGPDQELKFVFETQMKAELSSSETGEWSLISGSGNISDTHSPTTTVTKLSGGENKFLWKVRNSSCEASDEVKIIVYDPFIPSVITPNGDGKNDYFKISEIFGKIELIIFNRWGNEEYTNGNYLNDWDGRNNKGEELPNDTYFYVLRFENGKIKKGSVLIKR